MYNENSCVPRNDLEEKRKENEVKRKSGQRGRSEGKLYEKEARIANTILFCDRGRGRATRTGLYFSSYPL